jgi:glycosyltransferase involved in cell wall biosynthesis
LLIDPNDEQALVEAILLLQSDPEMRQALISRGMEQATKFSWDKSAGQTMDVYERIMNKNRA